MSVLIPIALAATIPLRNPFWPVGHVGEREPITDKPKIEIKTTSETASEEDTKTSVTAEAIAAANEAADDQQYASRLWIAARKELKIGGTMRTKDDNGSHQSVTINGRIYADGDLISFNHEGRRFTWRVKNLTEGGTLKLVRVRVREIEDADEKENENE